MCTPRTKTELEVDRLHRQLRPLNKRQQDWAIKNCCRLEWAHKYRGKNMSISHFVIATTKGEWQVLRMFYIYGQYRYKKLANTEIVEVMQEWFNNGKYVFYSRNRSMGYCNDAWTSQDMSIKRNVMGGWILEDPRNLSYENHRIERVTKQFAYTPIENDIDIRKAFRAVNKDRYAEAIIRKYPQLFDWCYSMKFVGGGYALTEANKDCISALRVATRHGYDVTQQDWKDHVDMLKREGYDIHNPHYICPENLAEAHAALCAQVERRRREQQRNWEREWREREHQRELERIERDKKAREEYPKARNRFFGILIEGQGLQIKCLQSVEEFKAEGDAMHHCVFSNQYYDMQSHPNSLILSAKKDGERVETIEVNLERYNIVQSRGKCNQNTQYHDTIIQLMNDNMGLIQQANKRRRRAV